jgi:hypothetical protein
MIATTIVPSATTIALMAVGFGNNRNRNRRRRGKGPRDEGPQGNDRYEF